MLMLFAISMSRSAASAFTMVVWSLEWLSMSTMKFEAGSRNRITYLFDVRASRCRGAIGCLVLR